MYNDANVDSSLGYVNPSDLQKNSSDEYDLYDDTNHALVITVPKKEQIIYVTELSHNHNTTTEEHMELYSVPSFERSNSQTELPFYSSVNFSSKKHQGIKSLMGQQTQVDEDLYNVPTASTDAEIVYSEYGIISDVPSFERSSSQTELPFYSSVNLSSKKHQGIKSLMGQQTQVDEDLYSVPTASTDAEIVYSEHGIISDGNTSVKLPTLSHHPPNTHGADLEAMYSVPVKKNSTKSRGQTPISPTARYKESAQELYQNTNAPDEFYQNTSSEIFQNMSDNELYQNTANISFSNTPSKPFSNTLHEIYQNDDYESPVPTYQNDGYEVPVPTNSEDVYGVPNLNF